MWKICPRHMCQEWGNGGISPSQSLIASVKVNLFLASLLGTNIPPETQGLDQSSLVPGIKYSADPNVFERVVGNGYLGGGVAIDFSQEIRERLFFKDKFPAKPPVCVVGV